MAPNLKPFASLLADSPFDVAAFVIPSKDLATRQQEQQSESASYWEWTSAETPSEDSSDNLFSVESIQSNLIAAAQTKSVAQVESSSPSSDDYWAESDQDSSASSHLPAHVSADAYWAEESYARTESDDYWAEPATRATAVDAYWQERTHAATPSDRYWQEATTRAQRFIPAVSNNCANYWVDARSERSASDLYWMMEHVNKAPTESDLYWSSSHELTESDRYWNMPSAVAAM